MAMTEDLGVFFNSGDFAVTATLNGAASGNVILDREYLRALGMVDSSSPLALAKAADYTEAAAVGGTLVAGGGTYVIRSVQPQDDGNIVLLALETT